MYSVYLETTVPSYVAAKPSRDLIVAAHQQITREWWQDARERFELFISEAVVAEIRLGDPEASARRLQFVQDLPRLQLNDDVRSLVRLYDEKLGLPTQAKVDVLHIAFAVGHGMDYLLTWNCAHIANGEVIRRLQEVNREIDQVTPIILTPEELSLGGLGEKK